MLKKKQFFGVNKKGSRIVGCIVSYLILNHSSHSPDHQTTRDRTLGDLLESTNANRQTTRSAETNGFEIYIYVTIWLKQGYNPKANNKKQSKFLKSTLIQSQ